MVKGVLGFRFGLCFLRLHLILAGSPFSATETAPYPSLSEEEVFPQVSSRKTPLSSNYETCSSGSREPRRTPADRNVLFLPIAGSRGVFRESIHNFSPPPGRRRKLASLPFCRETARFRPRTVTPTLLLVFISGDISLRGEGGGDNSARTIYVKTE